MRLGAHSFGFVWHEMAARTVERVADAGFPAIELLGVPGHLDVSTARITVGACDSALARTGIELLAVDLPAHDYNLASLDIDAATFSFAAHVRLLEVAADLGARYATIHGGRRIGLFPPPDDRQYAALRRNFDRLCSEAVRRRVALAIENIPIALLDTGEAIAAFLSAGGWNDVGVIYDVANALPAGEDPLAGLRAAGERLALVHLSDATPARPAHDPIGSGTVDFAAIGAQLAEQDFSGWAVLEVAAPDPLAALVEGRQALGRAGWRFAQGMEAGE